ncbi:sensor histidine kinase [Leptospira andrefontaineae]|uniref:histidine kinase n=1 Tax=Leptospira andrefontaineae TaxID=2484976 RepID=A0A4R9GWZ2_9LEPT|nr:sensor histidine kinase [Leptospira andrefontaineae]TGK35385.1 GHKL domain-containing protein [Leptospira andrefontaineae]
MRSSVFHLLVLLAFMGCSQKAEIYSPQAKDGILDLRDWDRDRFSTVALDGDWEFANAIISPESFVKDGFISVPGAWNSFTKNGKQHEGEGLGTYKLTVLLDKPVKDLAFQIGDISTAFKLFLNGKLLLENGKIGNSRTEMLPSYKHPIVLIDEESKELKLTLQISNYYHITGGLRKSIKLGNTLAVFEEKKRQVALGWVVFGATFFMGLYHLILFLMRRVDKSALWFGLFCIDLSIRGFFTGSVFIYEVTPDSLWVYIHKLDILTFVLALPLFSVFLKAVFPEEKYHYYFNNIFLSVSFVFFILVLVLPSTEYMNYIRIFQGFVGISIVYFFIMISLCIFKQREGAVLFAIGSIILFLTTLNDILNQSLIIKAEYLASWGLLAFLFSQTIMLSVRFSNAFVRLEELQKSLEQKVTERTKQLAEAKHIAEEANSLKDTFLSLVTHDLRSPITTVIGILQLIRNDYNQLDDRSLLEWVDRAEYTSSQSLEMIATLLDLNRLKSGSFPLDNNLIYVYPEVEGVLAKLLPQAEAKKIRIINEIPNDVKLNVDRTLFSEIFINLISNSIKFCRETDSIRIGFSNEKNDPEFFVEDTGIGMPKDMIPNLFLTEIKSTRLGTKNESGTGLGLPLVYSIIKAYNGKISVESEEKKGSKFTFCIPRV